MRDQIWITILDADRLTRYYGRMATTNKKIQFWLNVVVTLCSLAAATVLLIDVHKAVPAALFFVVAASTTWGIFAEYSKKATLAAHAAKLRPKNTPRLSPTRSNSGTTNTPTTRWSVRLHLRGGWTMSHQWKLSRTKN